MLTKRNIFVFILTIVLCSTCFCACASDGSINDESSASDLSTDDRSQGLSKDLEYEIKQALAESRGGLSDEEEFNPDSVSMSYYGNYNGYEAVICGFGEAVITPVEVGGHLFKFGTSNVILLYKDGEFIRFDDAFRQEKISQENLDDLYEAFSGEH